MKTKTTEHCQQITTNTINCLGLQIKKKMKQMKVQQDNLNRILNR